MLRLEHEWVWDFWHAHDGARHHLYFLKASRSLGDPDLRHFDEAVGHAVSVDLRNWSVLADVLAPSPHEGWDDGTVWTGSVVRGSDGWWMFYTGAKTSEQCLRQRIGAARSNDLTHWQRVGDAPLIEVDTRFYEALDLASWHDQAWRDPYVVEHDGLYHMFITARRNHGAADGRGTIAYATSADLLEWTVHPPIYSGTEFGHLEVPQVRQTADGWLLLFSCADPAFAKDFTQQTGVQPQAGTFVARASSIGGPYTLDSATPLYPPGYRDGVLYSGKLIDDGERGAQFLAFVSADKAGDFQGYIIDPLPATVNDSGRVAVEPASISTAHDMHERSKG